MKMRCVIRLEDGHRCRRAVSKPLGLRGYYVCRKHGTITTLVCMAAGAGRELALDTKREYPKKETVR